MKKIIALLCCLALFACIGGACGSKKGGETSSFISQSESLSSEINSSETESESSSEETVSSSSVKESCNDNETEQYYTVTFDSVGGSFVAEQRVRQGEKITKPENPKKVSTETVDYEFIAWYADGVEWDFDENTVEKDVILQAKWQEKKYSVDLPI